MTRRDLAIVGALVAAFALVAVLIALPRAAPAPSGVVDGGGATASPAPAATATAAPSGAMYREGILGGWTSITPLTARSNADRELVALVFSGLVRHGSAGQVLPDVASSWTVDSTGAHYTFRIRPDATWQDGVPVTAADVAFTFKTLQDPEYSGPQATSWREVTVVVLDDHTVRFDLATPLGGFLVSATQPLLPEHLLRGIGPADLAGSDFSRRPIGSGPFRLVSLDRLTAELELAVPSAAARSTVPSAGGSATTGDSSSPPTEASATTGDSPSASANASAGTAPPAAVGAPVARLQIQFFADAAALSVAYRAGRLDAVVGLTPAPAAALAALPGSRLLAYPSTTLTAVLMNQRGRSVFRTEAVRAALTMVVDRDQLVSGILLGQGVRADGLIPPGSWAFDARATKAIAHDTKAAAALLAKAGWHKLAGGWAAPGRSTALQVSMIAPDRDTNALTFAAASRVAKAWQAFGFKVRLEGLAPTAFAQRLQAGSYSLAAVDMNLGLDPDVYPLLASTQATTTGSNVSGVQSLVLDGLLEAARKPGSTAARKKAYAALEAFLSKVNVVIPLYFRDEPVVLAEAVQGPVVRQLGDPGDRFWDVLTWRLAGGQ